MEANLSNPIFEISRVTKKEKPVNLSVEINSFVQPAFVIAPLTASNMGVPRPNPSPFLLNYDEIAKRKPSDFIPCMLMKYSKGSSKLFLYFHANAEDLGRA
jgi:hypothetical protein